MHTQKPSVRLFSDLSFKIIYRWLADVSRGRSTSLLTNSIRIRRATKGQLVVQDL